MRPQEIFMKLFQRLKQSKGKQVQIYLDSGHDLLGALIEVNKNEIVLKHKSHLNYIPLDSIEGLTVKNKRK